MGLNDMKYKRVGFKGRPGRSHSKGAKSASPARAAVDKLDNDRSRSPSPVRSDAENASPMENLDEWEDELYTCESGRAKEDFRNYADGERQQRVENFYALQHEHQTMAYVREQRAKYLTFDKLEMGVWEALELLNSLTDESDPDTDVSQLQHALMTAEAIRKKYPGPEHEWFAVVGLVHDLGKLLSVKWGEPQWAVVGDTFPVGCAFSEKNVFPENFAANADAKHPLYSTQNGIYSKGCGISNLLMSWGHDEYMYQVCVHNKCTIPLEGLYMIRFHSFYPWHKQGEYKRFEDEQDKKMLFWVKEFNQFDLYSKGDEVKDVDKLVAYYKKAILKFFPEKLQW